MDVYQALLTPNLADSDPIMRYCTKKFLTMLVLYEIMEYSKAAGLYSVAVGNLR